MSQDVLDDWIASLLSTLSNREIIKLVHTGQDQFEPYKQHKQTIREFSIRWAAPPRLHLKSSKQ
jgi:hypothetical protein